MIDTITAGGSENLPRIQRIFWAIAEGVVAAILLLAGASISSDRCDHHRVAVLWVIILICWSLVQDLAQDPKAARK